MSQATALNLPLDSGVIAGLKAGDRLSLSGPCYTARDATLGKLHELMLDAGSLPDNLKAQLIFFAGPTPARAGRPFGSVGPTTAARMDALHMKLMPAGLTLTMGKGDRSDAYRAAARRYGALYLVAIGGTGTLLAKSVVSGEVIAWPELGTEALMKLELRDFPAFVGIDSRGDSMFEGGSTW